MPENHDTVAENGIKSTRAETGVSMSGYENIQTQLEEARFISSFMAEIAPPWSLTTSAQSPPGRSISTPPTTGSSLPFQQSWRIKLSPFPRSFKREFLPPPRKSAPPSPALFPLHLITHLLPSISACMTTWAISPSTLKPRR